MLGNITGIKGTKELGIGNWVFSSNNLCVHIRIPIYKFQITPHNPIFDIWQKQQEKKLPKKNLF